MIDSSSESSSFSCVFDFLLTRYVKSNNEFLRGFYQARSINLCSPEPPITAEISAATVYLICDRRQVNVRHPKKVFKRRNSFSIFISFVHPKERSSLYLLSICNGTQYTAQMPVLRRLRNMCRFAEYCYGDIVQRSANGTELTNFVNSQSNSNRSNRHGKQSSNHTHWYFHLLAMQTHEDWEAIAEVCAPH